MSKSTSTVAMHFLVLCSSAAAQDLGFIASSFDGVSAACSSVLQCDTAESSFSPDFTTLFPARENPNFMLSDSADHVTTTCAVGTRVTWERSVIARAGYAAHSQNWSSVAVYDPSGCQVTTATPGSILRAEFYVGNPSPIGFSYNLDAMGDPCVEVAAFIIDKTGFNALDYQEECEATQISSQIDGCILPSPCGTSAAGEFLYCFIFEFRITGSGERLFLPNLSDELTSQGFMNMTFSYSSSDLNGDGVAGDIFDLGDALVLLNEGEDFNGDGVGGDIYDLFFVLALIDLGENGCS